MSEYAKITGPDTVRLERVLPGPIERVWAYLTEPDKRAKWFAGGPMELRPGGQATFVFDHAALSAEKVAPEKYRKKIQGHSFESRVTACDPPRLLGYTFGDEDGKGGEVTFELTPQGKNVLLVLTHRRLPDRTQMRGVSGGWHSHLGILEDVLNGREPRGFWSMHAKVEAEYAKLFAD
jgi:uncharacterized protein YndB with AHSA1/START domain